ncbi:MAG: hypothetical protein HY707_04075 [Ignavibacteriae bacterium]|nr:hypothetical protein [Ignavibacteriota bacterium]
MRGDIILPETIKDKLGESAKRNDALPIISPVFSTSREHILNLFEEQFLVDQLSKHRGNVTAAAKASKMTRQNFHALMKKYNIRAERFRI